MDHNHKLAPGGGTFEVLENHVRKNIGSLINFKSNYYNYVNYIIGYI
jgi:hypothetical protein